MVNEPHEGQVMSALLTGLTAARVETMRRFDATEDDYYLGRAMGLAVAIGLAKMATECVDA